MGFLLGWTLGFAPIPFLWDFCWAGQWDLPPAHFYKIFVVLNTGICPQPIFFGNNPSRSNPQRPVEGRGEGRAVGALRDLRSPEQSLGLLPAPPSSSSGCSCLLPSPLPALLGNPQPWQQRSVYNTFSSNTKIPFLEAKMPFKKKLRLLK